MRKGNGSNGIPAWAKRDLQLLKRVTVSLIDVMRETRRDMAQSRRDMAQSRRDMAESRRDMAESRRNMVELRKETQRRFAENEKMIVELVRLNDRLEGQTTSLKKTSDIHSKAILKLLKKI